MLNVVIVIDIIITSIIIITIIIINVLSGAKCCPSPLETVGIRVPTRTIRNFNMFSCFSSHCLLARCVSAANSVCKRRDIFCNSCLSVKNFK
jgi:hypothetical protein